MNRSKFRLPALLLALLLSAQTIACGGGGETKDTSNDSSEVTTADPADERLAIDDGLPQKDFEEYEFRILPAYFGKVPVTLLYAPEESTGDVVDDAIFNRNKRVEERFNITITEIESPYSNYNEHGNYIKTSVMSDEDAFDLTLNHIIGGPNLSLDSVFYNLYDLEYLDFSKPWWSDQMIDEMTVRGQAYLVGDVIGLGALKSAKVLFINKGKFEDYKLELPYQTVLDGKWTMDGLMTMTKDVYDDLNGNSERDVDDFYGYSSHASQNGWLVSCDIPVLEKDDDETLKIVVNGDKVASLVEKVYKLYYEQEGSLIVRGNDPVTGDAQTDWQAKLFANGHSLIGFSTLGMASTTMRESNVEYGIIPFPKWDENQKDYRTFCGGVLIGIPGNIKDSERTSIILEALAAESYKTVVPAYFDTALKEKFTFDAESGQMLDIINGSLAVSFAYAYDNWQGFGHMMGAILANDNPSSDYASFYASRITSAETRLQKIIDFFEKNAE